MGLPDTITVNLTEYHDQVKAQSLTSYFSSGIEEEYGERERLLREFDTLEQERVRLSDESKENTAASAADKENKAAILRDKMKGNPAGLAGECILVYCYRKLLIWMGN